MSSNKTYSTEQLLAQLEQARQPAGNCVVLCGDETLLLNEARDAISQIAQQKGCDERTHLVMDARSDWSQALAWAQSGSLFSLLRLLEISLPGGKPGKNGAEVLGKLSALMLAGQLADVLMLIKLPRLDSTTRNSKWLKELKAISLWVDIPSIARRQLPGWIAQRLAQQQQTTDAEVLEWLSAKVEGNLLAAHQEIQKLALLYPHGHLQAEQVYTAVLNVARYNPFDLREAVLLGQTTRALDIMAGLRAEGVAILLVLWALGEEIRLIARLAGTDGRNLTQSMRSMRIFGAREQQMRTMIERTPSEFWPLALGQLHEIDRIVKGVPARTKLTDPWLELSRLIMRMARYGGARQ